MRPTASPSFPGFQRQPFARVGVFPQTHQQFSPQDRCRNWKLSSRTPKGRTQSPRWFPGLKKTKIFQDFDKKPRRGTPEGRKQPQRNCLSKTAPWPSRHFSITLQWSKGKQPLTVFAYERKEGNSSGGS